jgi:phosphohistidine phosphatase
MSERLLIMRHGQAVSGAPDDRRELTGQGRREVARMADWLARHRDGEAPLRVLASPYVRARQTADLMAEALGSRVETLSIITPDDAPDAVGDWLLEQPKAEPLLLVSHMPLVSALTGWLVEGREDQGPGFPTAAIAELQGDLLARGCVQLLRFTAPSDIA